MDNVPRDELRAIEVALQEWRNPDEFGAIVRALNERMPNKQFQRQPGLQFFREAYNAAGFAKAVGCDLVRLCAESWPDFETRKDGVMRGYELVEAMESGRKRGDEDWDSGKLEAVPVSEWRRVAMLIPSELRKAVKKKVDKDYPRNSSGLVVYLNVGSTFGILQKEIEADLQAATARAKDVFVEVWVAWGNKHYLLWRDGNASNDVFQSPLDP